MKRLLQPEAALGCGGRFGAGEGGAASAGLNAVAASVLGLVEGGVGGVEEFFRVGSGAACGDAEAQGYVKAGSSGHDAAVRDAIADAFRQFPDFGRAAIRGDDKELFSAIAADRVVGTHHSGDFAGDDAQDDVAGGVAATVIHFLEIVHVGHDHAHGLAMALGAQQFAVENFQNHFVIPQASQAIVRSFATQGFLGADQAGLSDEKARARTDERKKNHAGRQAQTLPRDAQRHDQHQQRVKQVKHFAVDFFFGPRRALLVSGDRLFGSSPRSGQDQRNDQHHTPENVEPGASLESAAGAVEVESVDTAGQGEEKSKPPEKLPG